MQTVHRAGGAADAAAWPVALLFHPFDQDREFSSLCAMESRRFSPAMLDGSRVIATLSLFGPCRAHGKVDARLGDLVRRDFRRPGRCSGAVRF
jgi:hypothetical protein